MAPRKTPNSLVLFYDKLLAPGGAERLLLEEELFFRNKGIETVILTFAVNPRALYDYTPHKLEVIEAKNSIISNARELRRKLKQINPDIVIAVGSIYPYLSTLFTSIPYILHLHGTLFWFDEDMMKYAYIHKQSFSEIRDSVIGHKEFIPEHPHQYSFGLRVASEFWARVDRAGVRKARAIVTLNEHLKWEIKKLYEKDAIVAQGCLPTRALSYQPTQDIKQKLGLTDKTIVLSVGRLDPRKRIDVLVKSFASILLKYRDLYLLIAGTGEEDKQLRKLVDDLGITSKVLFLGFIPDSELFDYYAACDVFAFPSWTSFGITPYEALALGKKVVWTSEADHPIIKDSHVFLAAPTVDGVARGLENALTTNVEGRADLSNYTWDKYFDVVYKVVIDAINK